MYADNVLLIERKELTRTTLAFHSIFQFKLLKALFNTILRKGCLFLFCTNKNIITAYLRKYLQKKKLQCCYLEICISTKYFLCFCIKKQKQNYMSV